jgi:hypothetical protein
VFAIEAWRNEVVLKPFEAMPAAELRAKQNDEAWCVAMRRASLLMHVGNKTRAMLLRDGEQRSHAKSFSDAVRRSAAAAAVVVSDITGSEFLTAGLFATLHAPELRLLLRGSDALALALAHRLVESATSALADRFEELRRGGNATQARELLLREGFELPEQNRYASVLFSFLAGISPYATARLRDWRDAAELVDAAADDEDEQGRVAVVWRFKLPRKGSAERVQMDDAFRCGNAASVAGCIPAHFASPLKRKAPVPALQCDVRACLEPLYAAAARRPGGPAAALRDALLAQVAANDPAVLDPCINCEACRTARRTGAKCALPGCPASRRNGVALKRCGRCLTAAYCSNECQKKDLARHKKEDCTPPNE